MQPRKIRLEHLDDVLIAWLNNFLKSGTIEFSDLSKDLQEAIRTHGGTSDYNDFFIRKAVKELQDDKADKAELKNYFKKREDRVELGDLSKDLRVLMDYLAEFKKSANEGFRKNDDPIKESDLDGGLKNKINSSIERLDYFQSVVHSLEIIVNKLMQQGGISEKPGEGIYDAEELKAILSSITEIKKNVREITASLNDATEKARDNTKRLDKIEEFNETVVTKTKEGTIKEDMLPDSVVKRNEYNDNLADVNKKLNELDDKTKAFKIEGKAGHLVSIVDNKDDQGKSTPEILALELFPRCVFINTKNKRAVLEKAYNRMMSGQKVDAVFFVCLEEDNVYIMASELITISGTKAKNYKYLTDVLNIHYAYDHIHDIMHKPDEIKEEDIPTIADTYKYFVAPNISQNAALNQKICLDYTNKLTDDKVYTYMLLCNEGKFVNPYTLETVYDVVDFNAVKNKDVVTRYEDFRLSNTYEYQDIKLMPNAFKEISGIISLSQDAKVYVQDDIKTSESEQVFVMAEGLVALQYAFQVVHGEDYREVIASVINNSNRELTVRVIYKKYIGLVEGLENPKLAMYTNEKIKGGER